MKRIVSALLVLMMVVSLAAVIPTTVSATEQPNEIQFRGFNAQKSDYACHSATGFYKTDIPCEGSGYMGGKITTQTNEIHHFIYGYNQNQNDANGKNADGTVEMLITDPTSMYVSFDFYVSDASVINNPAGDCNFGIDTKEFGTKEAWGSTFISRRDAFVKQLAQCKTGWNHILLPLSITTASYKTEMVNQTVTFLTMRFYITGITAPVGFITAVDDVRIMNEAAAFTVAPERTLAKSVTDGVRNYPASATYNDFYQVYLAYVATKDEYKSLVKGWDAFASLNTQYMTQAQTDAAADKAAADAVKALIAPLYKEIVKEDKAAVEQARAAYDGLTDLQKSIVTNITTLETAEKDVANAITKYNKEQANAVVTMISKLPTKGFTKEHKTVIEEARAAYDALTDEQKALVGNLDTLVTAEGKLDEVYAGEVKLLLLELPTEVTKDHRELIEAARAAYEGLTDSQKEKVPNLYMLTEAEEKLAALDNQPDQPVDPVEPAKIPYGDVNGDEKVDAKDALEVLKAAVDKVTLTEEQMLRAEVDAKEGINAKDALEILKYTVGKIEKFPIELA